MRWTAGAHIVFGMDFEEVDGATAFENCVGVLRLQSHSGADRAER